MRTSLSLISAVLLLGLTSCMTTGFEIKTKLPSDPGKTVVVVPATFGERDIAPSPVVDAAAYHTAYQSSIEGYLSLESIQAAKATAKTVEAFKTAGYKVVTAPNSLTLSLANSMGAFFFWEGDPAWGLFRPLVQQEASATGADYVVAEGWRAIVDAPGYLGLMGTSFHVIGRIAVFSKEGSLVGLGTFHSDSAGGGTSDYEVKLSASEGAKEVLLKALTAPGK